MDRFDAVHHMLESLPERVGEAFVQGQIVQTQDVLNSINSQLSARVMRSYGAFVHGMAQVCTTSPPFIGPYSLYSRHGAGAHDLASIT